MYIIFKIFLEEKVSQFNNNIILVIQLNKNNQNLICQVEAIFIYQNNLQNKNL